MNKAFIKSLIPPVILDLWRGSRPDGPTPTLAPPFASWSKAIEHCKGYEDADLIESVVQRNIAEAKQSPPKLTDRDAQIFSAVLLALNRTGKSDNRVTDFGGELGGFYRTMRRIAPNLPISKWTVIETARMCERGKELFPDDKLEFGGDLSRPGRVDVVLASGTLQCVKDPETSFRQIVNTGASHVILSLVPLIPGGLHVLTAGLGARNYPLWMFSEQKFRRMMGDEFQILAEWDVAKADTMHDGTAVRYGGFMLQRKPAVPLRHPTG